jgi:hypothetical protein
MSATLLDVWQAIADRLRTLDVEAYHHIPGHVDPPAAIILPPRVEYEGLGSGYIEARFTVAVFVTASLYEHQLKLFDWLDLQGERSILTAFAAEPSLGLNGVNVTVTGARPLHQDQFAGYAVFGAQFEMTARIG